MIASPASPVACGVGAAGAVAAASTVAEVALPPLALVTNRAAAVAVVAPKVHDTVIDVADATVAAPQVPSAVAVTVAPAPKPVPVRVKAVVEFAEAVAGAGRRAGRFVCWGHAAAAVIPV